jgi:hypothetical protein
MLARQQKGVAAFGEAVFFFDAALSFFLAQFRIGRSFLPLLLLLPLSKFRILRISLAPGGAYLFPIFLILSIPFSFLLGLGRHRCGLPEMPRVAIVTPKACERPRRRVPVTHANGEAVSVCRSE